LDRILSLSERASIVISPSRSGEGTNALLLTPPDVSPTFYGSRSFQKHIDEAQKRKISFFKLRSSRIALDIDTVKDLEDFVLLNSNESSAYKLLDNSELLNKIRISSQKL
jgi:2-phospho-L-lactate guanylyltransferase